MNCLPRANGFILFLMEKLSRKKIAEEREYAIHLANYKQIWILGLSLTMKNAFTVENIALENSDADVRRYTTVI